LLLSPLLLLGTVLAVLYRCTGWPLCKRWKQRPFDPAVWKENPPPLLGAYTTQELSELDPTGGKKLPGRRGYDARDARYWMVDDLIKRVRGKSQEEVRALLGEPNPPSPSRVLLVGKADRWHMAYALAPEGVLGRPELLIRLDEQGRVKEAKVARSAT
jgi:hypothetical protein